jgi:hypothetical protein
MGRVTGRESRGPPIIALYPHKQAIWLVPAYDPIGFE